MNFSWNGRERKALIELEVGLCLQSALIFPEVSGKACKLTVAKDSLVQDHANKRAFVRYTQFNVLSIRTGGGTGGGETSEWLESKGTAIALRPQTESLRHLS